MTAKDITFDDCRVLLASPVDYEECVVFVETSDALVFVLSDEHRSGSCLLELPGDGERIAKRIPLDAFRTLLDAAERQLTGDRT